MPINPYPRSAPLEDVWLKKDAVKARALPQGWSESRLSVARVLILAQAQSARPFEFYGIFLAANTSSLSNLAHPPPLTLSPGVARSPNDFAYLNARAEGGMSLAPGQKPKGRDRSNGRGPRWQRRLGYAGRGLRQAIFTPRRCPSSGRCQGLAESQSRTRTSGVRR